MNFEHVNGKTRSRGDAMWTSQDMFTRKFREDNVINNINNNQVHQKFGPPSMVSIDSLPPQLASGAHSVRLPLFTALLSSG